MLRRKQALDADEGRHLGQLLLVDDAPQAGHEHIRQHGKAADMPPLRREVRPASLFKDRIIGQSETGIAQQPDQRPALPPAP